MFTEKEFIDKITKIDPINRKNKHSTYHFKYSKTHSRNTKIYCFEVEGQAYIAKLNSTMSSDDLYTEYVQYTNLQDLLEPYDVRSLDPIAFVKEMGVIITKEEKGITLHDLLLQYLDSVHSEKILQKLVLAVEKSAYALYTYHNVYNKNVTKERKSKSYLDFSPSNILLAESEIIILDLPEKNITQSVYFDLGVFCFELNRVFLKRKKWFGQQFSIANHLKYTFIQKYHQLYGESITHENLDKVKQNEVFRIKKVIRYYRNFRKYDDVIMQFLRCMFIVPVILFYYKLVLPKGYKEIESQL